MGLNRELDGFFVVSLEQAVAAPYCGLLLADAGARVVKVERPEGDFARSYDRGANGQSTIFCVAEPWQRIRLYRSQRSVGRGYIARHAAPCRCVFAQSCARCLGRRGFGGDALRADNPGLITCDISGYGTEGAAATKKAYDFLVQAEAGICAVTGTKDSPARVGISLCDIGSGLTAFSAILRALIQRGRTGVGVDLSIAMFDVMADWMNMPLMGHRYFGPAPQRLGLTHTFVAPYGAFTASDGQVLISIQNNREWAGFCDAILMRPELATDPRFADNPDRVTNRDVLTDIINGVFCDQTVAALLTRLAEANIACARLSSVADLSDHAFLRTLDLSFGGAAVSVADLPVKTEGARPGHVPALGEHTALIKQEFG